MDYCLIGESRELEYVLVKIFWRGFLGINGLKIQGFFEKFKVLWNVLVYFKENFICIVFFFWKNSGLRGFCVSVKFYFLGVIVIDIDYYRRLYNNNFIKVYVNIINLMKLIEEIYNFIMRWKKILKCKNMLN